LLALYEAFNVCVFTLFLAMYEAEAPANAALYEELNACFTALYDALTVAAEARARRAVTLGDVPDLSNV
jgi:hypothetical protein